MNSFVYEITLKTIPLEENVLCPVCIPLDERSNCVCFDSMIFNNGQKSIYHMALKDGTLY